MKQFGGKYFAIVFGFLLLSNNVLAGLDDANAEIAVYGTACEKFGEDDAKASVRVRATDRACFDAVKNLPSVKEFKQNHEEQDFNVLVYSLVDNYLQDLSARTTKQTENDICVEISGYLMSGDIAKAKQLLSEPTPADEDVKARIEEVKQFEALPVQPMEEKQTEPKPQIKPAEVEIKPLPVAKPQKTEPLIYVADLQFYDNTSSPQHGKIIKDMVAQNPSIYLTKEAKLADYIIKSKVLKAKVDRINSATKRLQMVVSVELEDVKKQDTTIEHQNRFILFNSDEDAQKVAGDLMQKLLTKATEPAIKRINKNIGANNSLPKIITPQTVNLY